MQTAPARRDDGHISGNSLLPQFSFRTQYSFYATEAVPGFDVTEPLLRVFGQTNFAQPTSWGISGAWSTTFRQASPGASSTAGGNSGPDGAQLNTRFLGYVDPANIGAVIDSALEHSTFSDSSSGYSGMNVSDESRYVYLKNVKS